MRGAVRTRGDVSLAGNKVEHEICSKAACCCRGEGGARGRSGGHTLYPRPLLPGIFQQSLHVEGDPEVGRRRAPETQTSRPKSVSKCSENLVSPLYYPYHDLLFIYFFTVFFF